MTNPFWEQFATANGEALRSLPPGSRSVTMISASGGLGEEAKALLGETARVLSLGGWLFVYGQPKDLPSWAETMMRLGAEDWCLVFKYWIALDVDDTPRDHFLKPVHRGLLMFLKHDPRRKTSVPFQLNTADVKFPHRICPVCDRNVKDWGGKKHLMNPKGIALSDVWRDLPRTRLTNALAPDAVLERIRLLTGAEGEHGLHVVQMASHKADRRAHAKLDAGATQHRAGSETGAPVVEDQVVLGDCIPFLNDLAQKHPEGVFDLAFADPPYNLAKKYDQYADERADQDYIDWCNQWLDGMARTLKPGGSLFVLNLPKWAIHHAVFLQSRLELRHWIVWDALSDPRGKLMPAHYSLLYYTKPGAKPVFNYSPVGRKPIADFALPPDSPKYCLRASCVKQRKAMGDDEKVELADIWSDVHRIKHRRDRDAHPCQLPDKLMERIIRLTTSPGDVVFDPFCGAGTTAIAARKLGRHFVVTECDAAYVDITKRKLAAMKEHADMFGEYIVPRAATQKQRAFITKKAIELFLQELAVKLERVPTEAEIQQADRDMLPAIDRLYPNRGAALKRCKVVLGVK